LKGNMHQVPRPCLAYMTRPTRRRFSLCSHSRVLQSPIGSWCAARRPWAIRPLPLAYRGGRTYRSQVTSVTYAPTGPRRHSAQCDAVLTGARSVWHRAESRHPAQPPTVRGQRREPAGQQPIDGCRTNRHKGGGGGAPGFAYARIRRAELLGKRRRRVDMTAAESTVRTLIRAQVMICREQELSAGQKAGRQGEGERGPSARLRDATTRPQGAPP
jgi:hypothetical protein